MINDIYELVLAILNKELRGNITPSEFNIIANLVQREIYRGYFESEARDKVKTKTGAASQGYSNLQLVQRERIDEFSRIASLTYNSGYFDLPSDLHLIKDSGVTYNGTVVEESQSRNFTYAQDSISAPSLTFPVYEKLGNQLAIYPSTIVSGVSVRYLKEPSHPKWTYTIIQGSPLFNPAASDFQDFELHKSEFSNICVRMLSYLGVNLREQDVMTYAEALKQQNFNKEE